MSSVEHPNIIKLYGTTSNKPKVYNLEGFLILIYCRNYVYHLLSAYQLSIKTLPCYKLFKTGHLFIISIMYSFFSPFKNIHISLFKKCCLVSLLRKVLWSSLFFYLKRGLVMEYAECGSLYNCEYATHYNTEYR